MHPKQVNLKEQYSFFLFINSFFAILQSAKFIFIFRKSKKNLIKKREHLTYLIFIDLYIHGV